MATIAHARRRLTAGVIAVLVGSVVAGCAPARRPAAADAPRSTTLLAFDKDGQAVNPLDHYRPMDNDSQYVPQMGEVLDAMTAFHACHPGKRIVVFVHGGLVSQDDVLSRSIEQAEAIKVAGAYPLFVAWNSELLSSYGEHLFEVRQGRKDFNPTHVATAPLYFLGDLGRAVFRAPAVWTHLAGTDFPGAGARLRSISHGQPHWLEDENELRVDKFYSVLHYRYVAGGPGADGAPGHAIRISLGPEDSTSNVWLADTGRYAATLAPKLVTSPLIDALGQAAWQNMSRRTVNLFEDPLQLSLRRDRGHDVPNHNIGRLLDTGGQGDLQRFLERLHVYMDHNGGAESFDVTLVGHSMGTMVLNQLIRRDAWLRPRSIVYMAAACTIHDFRDSVVRFMEDEARECRRPRFYNLCLHPTAEILDAEYAEVPPRGSLLVWIDEFLGQPETPLDRTLGRWDNILPASYVIPQDLRAQVTIKGFSLFERDPADPKRRLPNHPETHGDFSHCTYWDPAFWEALPADDPGLNRRYDQMNRRLVEYDPSFKDLVPGPATRPVGTATAP